MAFGKKDTTPEPSDELFKTTREIEAYFTEKNLKFGTKRLGNISLLETGMRSTNAGAVKIVFVSTDDNAAVAVRSYNIVPHVPEEKKAAILEVINKLNAKYRFVKFVLDKDSVVNAEYDIPAAAGEIGKVAMEVFIRFAQVVDEAYPDLMKTIWS